MAERLLRVEQVAEMISTCEETVRRYCRSGRIKAVKLPGGQFRIGLKALEEYVSQFAQRPNTHAV